VSKDISACFLELLAFLHKEKQEMPAKMLEAAKECAIGGFLKDGDLGSQVPAIVV
jgi:hypothetical protein